MSLQISKLSILIFALAMGLCHFTFSWANETNLMRSQEDFIGRLRTALLMTLTTAKFSPFLVKRLALLNKRAQKHISLRKMSF
jgi:hypothetical protein